MDTKEKERLKFRRQYIITKQEIDCPFLHHVYKLKQDYFLYAHIDLQVTQSDRDGLQLILLGDMLDWEEPDKDNTAILNDLQETQYEKFQELTARYAGRFVLIHIDQNNIRLMHDATSCRKIYYYNSGSGFWCASQPHLLAQISGVNRTTDPEKLSYYQSEIFKHHNHTYIGDLTCYEPIFQLLPNHYLNLTEGKIYRYWIKTVHERMSMKKTAGICGKMLQGYIKSINHRYNIMLPVTAGKDSRTLLAATKDIQDKVFYYINSESRISRRKEDILIPQKIITEQGQPFHVLDTQIEIDNDFKEIYFSNNPDASHYYLPHIYNYYRNFQDKVNLPGNFVASAYDMYGYYVKKATPELVAVFNWVSDYGFAIDYYKRWLENCMPFCKEHHIRFSTLLYWEERLANWGTQLQIDKDIAQEDLIPYNSRQLINYFFSVKPKYIDRPEFRFFCEIMKQLWPELLLTPINPGFKKRTSTLLFRLGLLQTIRKILFLYQIKLKSIQVVRRNKKTKRIASMRQLFACFFVKAILNMDLIPL
jgi:hypothetical protein